MGQFRKSRLCSAIGMLVASKFASAAVFVVDTRVDTVTEDGQVSLREALQAANSNSSVNADVGAGDVTGDIITFDATVFADATAGLISISAGFEISDDVRIDSDYTGSPATVVISGQGSSRIFDIATTEPVEMEGIALLNGSATGSRGGAIRLGDGGDLTLDTVNISGSVADAGGGIEVTGGTLTVSNSTISMNSALINGGALHVTNAATVTVTGSSITGNVAGQEGGGLWNSASGGMTITGSTVSGNTAEITNAANDAQGGGGVFNNGGTVTISNSSIANNAVSGGVDAGADDGGGGIFNDGRNAAGARIDLNGSTTISNNLVLSTSLNGGGGLNIGSAGNGTRISAGPSVVISGNSAARAGGGLESNNATLTLTGTTISGNSAGVNGGGVHLTGADSATLSDAAIAGNTAGQEGGGLWNSASGNMSISSSTISGNTALIGNSANDAQGGGGVFNNGGTVTIANTPVVSNVVSGDTASNADDGGGGIFNDGRNRASARIDLTGSTTIAGNLVLTTSLNGGGGLNIGTAGNGARITAGPNVVISGNSAARAGGGLESNNATLTLTGTTISGNSAGVNGGGVHLTGADTATFSGTEVTANTAGQEGGGLWNSASGNMSVSNSTVTFNTALIANAAFDAQGGGGVFNNGGTVSLASTLISDNTVQGDTDAGGDDGGGGIFNDGRNTTGARISLTGTTTISDNLVLTTSLNGGGGLNIGVASSGAQISATTGVQITGNRAARAGGGLESNNATLTLTGTTISGNSAGVNGGGVHVTALDQTRFTSSTISNNRAGQEGGGLWNSSTGNMSISGSTIASNTALAGNSADAQGGGGVFNNGGTVTLQGSQVKANLVVGDLDPTDGGGGVFSDGRNTSGALFEIIDSQITDNTVTDTTIGTIGGRGGGALNISSNSVGLAGSMVITGGSITGNTARQAGGGVETNSGVLALDGVTVSNNSVAINGGGLHVQAADVTTINNSTFSSNTAGQEGGGLWNSSTGNMSISGSTIASNTALAGNSADAQGGGGVFNNGGTVTLQGSQVKANLVIGELDPTDGGGGVFSDGRNTSGALFEIIDSFITDNTVTDTTIGTIGGRGGGALNISSNSVGLAGSMVITGGSITGNTARQAGGGVETNSGVLALDGVTVSNNSVAINGGGLHVQAADITTVTKSTVSSNTAGQEGGGLWNSSTGNMTVSDSTIVNNLALVGNSADAQGGGGLFNNGGTLTLQRSQIVGNRVEGDLASTDGGGGVFNDARNTDGALVQIVDSDFIDNNTLQTGTLPLGGRGGGLTSIADNSNAASITISGGSFSGNFAAQAGGGIELRVLDSDTMGLASSGLTLADVVFDANITQNNGGAIHLGGTSGNLPVDIQDSRFIGNEAGNEGGAIWVENNPNAVVAVTASLMDGNSAPNGGGAFMNGGGSPGSLSFDRSAIVRNIAGTGGGIDTEGGTLSLINSTVSGNNASASGGGLNIDSGTAVDLRFTTIASNVAGNQGGGLQVPAGSSVALLSSILADNSAPTGADASGTVTNARYSLISDTDGVTITTADSVVLNVDPVLAPLRDNGGPTPTHALLMGSPALDSAENAICPGTDQRGRVRDDGLCDMGAFESVEMQTGPDFVVNDVGDGGDGSCRVAPDVCTLRDAIEAANLDPDLSTITFDGTVFATPQAIVLASGELVVSTDVIIDAGGFDITVDANNASRVFHVDNGVGGNSEVMLSGLTVTRGSTFGDGGGILSHENLTLTDVVLTRNTADHGGGLFAAPGYSGTITITNSTITGNTANGAGGGAALDVENATVVADAIDLSGNVSTEQGGGARIRGGNGATVMWGGSLVSANQSGLHGGGFAVYLSGDAALTLADSTISGNTATASGGGVVVERIGSANSLVIDGVTIANNTADLGADENGTGGGLWVSNQFDPIGGVVTLMGTVVATNLDADGPGSNDLGLGSNYSQFQAFNSLIGDNTGSGLAEAPIGSPDINGNLIGDPSGEGVIDPLFGVLADNGGLTMTHLPLSGSPLVDHFTACSGSDQRGVARGLDADGVAGSDCDIGAVEIQNTLVTAVDDTPTTDQDSVAAGNVLTNDIDAADDDDGTLAVTAVNGIAGNVGATVPGSGGGEISIAADGSFSFDPLGDFVALGATQSATTEADYTVFDGFASDAGTLRVTVDGLNDPPVPQADNYLTSVGFDLTADAATGVLANDTDIDNGDVLTAVAGLFNDPVTGGTLDLATDGSFVFTPGTAGSAVFDYTVSDGNAQAMSTVTIDVVASDPVDLSITKSDGIRIIEGGELVTYQIEAANAGPGDAIDAQVQDIVPAGLLNAIWSCSASAGASCPVNGTGDIDETVTIPAGGSVLFQLTAIIDPDIGTPFALTNTATVTSHPGVPDIDLGNNQASDTNVTDLVFTDSFEMPVMVKAAFEARRATIHKSLISGALPANGAPALVGQAVLHDEDMGLVQVFARRRAGVVELLVIRLEGDVWMPGEWTRMNGDSAEVRW